MEISKTKTYSSKTFLKMIRIKKFNFIIGKFPQMPKLLYNVLKISGGANAPNAHLVARLSNYSDHYTPLLNTRIWKGASNQAVALCITRPLHAIVYKVTHFAAIFSY